MAWEQEVITAFKDSNVDFVSYLPDSTLWPLVRGVEDDEFFDTVLVSREEEAVGIVNGAWLGGRKPALLCQTSGLANTFNALGSLSKPWGIPFVGIVDRRGGIGEHNLAQIPAGYGMDKLLDVLGIRSHSLTNASDVETEVAMAIDTAFSTEDPIVLILEPTLTGGKR